MKKTRLAIMLVLVCLVFVGCGAKKPSTKQIRKDIEGSQIISFPIESMEIRSDQGDKEDYRARVRLTGKRDIFEITTDAILRYEKVGKAWELTDYEVPSDSVKATISRCPTEQDILTGFSSLHSVETYIAYDGCFVNEDSSIEPSYDKKCRMTTAKISVRSIPICCTGGLLWLERNDLSGKLRCAEAVPDYGRRYNQTA